MSAFFSEMQFSKIIDVLDLHAGFTKFTKVILKQIGLVRLQLANRVRESEKALYQNKTIIVWSLLSTVILWGQKKE